jgi:hypothetical protein
MWGDLPAPGPGEAADAGPAGASLVVWAHQRKEVVQLSSQPVGTLEVAGR